MMGIPIKTADLSKWELTDCGLKWWNLHWTNLGPLNVADRRLVEAVFAATGMGLGFIPSA